MEFIKSCNLTEVNNITYLAIYFKEEYIPSVLINQQKVRQNPILIQEPSASDWRELEVLSIVLNRFHAYAETKQMAIFNKFDIERQKEHIMLCAERLKQSAGNEVVTAIENKVKQESLQNKDQTEDETIKQVIMQTFLSASDYEELDTHGNTRDFFTERLKFLNFLNTRTCYEFNEDVNPCLLINKDCLPQLFSDLKNGKHNILMTEIICLYICFFLEYFTVVELSHHIQGLGQFGNI